ncbi:MAG: PQQ-like beta-propeller repeat protein [Planctomycetes bacterium]|nr:PQQ-like beta-propeller repeat protein [Planctomycetota bacterium]
MSWLATLPRFVGRSLDKRLCVTPRPACAARFFPAETSGRVNFAALALLSLALALLPVQSSNSADWPQFRGPNGLGISDDTTVPLVWSDSKNLKWKTPLPGPGSSSPIVYGQYVFVTCYSGYGIDRENPGSIDKLNRHLLCIDRNDGKVTWSRTVRATLPEDVFGGMGVPEHGYATNTPVTDGQRVYVFFGKTGVLAFDFKGKQLWHVNVGQESSNRRWGSAASLILYKDTVIVNASEESRSIRALNKLTGMEIWKAEGDSLELSYGTPLLVPLDDGGKELVIGVPYEVWGLNPATGKLNWYAENGLDGNVAPSPVADGGIVYIFGGYHNTGSMAVRAGGKDNVTDTHVRWTSRDGSYVPSPVIHKGKLYWVSDQGIAYCADVKTGETVYRERLPRRAGGGGGKPFYASVVLTGDKLICVSRRGGSFVLTAKPQFEQLAHNEFPSDDSDFNASPAISDGQVFLRSNRFLYCIQDD